MRRSCFGGDDDDDWFACYRSRIFGISWICGYLVLEDRIVAPMVQEMAIGKRASTG